MRGPCGCPLSKRLTSRKQRSSASRIEGYVAIKVPEGVHLLSSWHHFDHCFRPGTSPARVRRTQPLLRRPADSTTEKRRRSALNEFHCKLQANLNDVMIACRCWEQLVAPHCAGRLPLNSRHLSDDTSCDRRPAETVRADGLAPRRLLDGFVDVLAIPDVAFSAARFRWQNGTILEFICTLGEDRPSLRPMVTAAGDIPN